MTSGQYRALVLLLVILGIEILVNPVVRALLGGWLSYGNKIRTFTNTGAP